jgi:hypothetical protein
METVGIGVVRSAHRMMKCPDSKVKAGFGRNIGSST